MLVLGIETSCDETAAAIVQNGKGILSNVVLSSLRFHKPYGGVVPEIASRHHAELIDAVIKDAFLKAGAKPSSVQLIAVTNGPGLIGSLLVGLLAAKGLALAFNKPLIKINHVRAHLYAPFMKEDIRFPFVGLVVSGGHTDLIFVKDYNCYQELGRTTDDAAGEAFDKAARILGLSYPGGPIIERLAKNGDPSFVKFPRSLLGGNSLDFSFSGIKTALLYYAHKNRRSLTKYEPSIPGICASFQEAVFDVIAEKSARACIHKNSKRLVAGGGVSINLRLRQKLNSECGKFGIKVYFPSKELCLDNAAMVAGLGYQIYKRRPGYVK